MKKIVLAIVALTFVSYGSAALADQVTEKTETHKTDGKTTTKTKKVKRAADGEGNSSVKTETVEKTTVTK